MRAALVLLALALVASAPRPVAAQVEPTPTEAPAPSPTPSPAPTLYPTPAPLSGGELAPAMGAVMREASSLSMQPIGMGLLALAGVVVMFEVLRIFLLKRSSQ